MTEVLMIEPATLPVPSRLDISARVARALTRGAAHLVTARRAGRLDDKAIAGVVQRTFGDLGGTFIKFGQLIASSPSIFGDAVAHEFRTFLDSGPSVPYAQVRAVIERDLGRSLGDVFASFEHEPMAAASLAVVHRATLVDGMPVAVKVLRPD